MSLMFWQVVCGALGATLIVTRGAIFAFPRTYVKVLSCGQCVGFWLGGAIASFYLDVRFSLLCAAATSALALIVSLQYPPIIYTKRNNPHGVRKPPVR